MRTRTQADANTPISMPRITRSTASATSCWAVDGDPPGAALLADLALRLGKSRCRWLRYPAGCKDLNDVLAQARPDGRARA